MQGKVEPAHISMLKRNNVAMALECARLSRDLLGANGIMDEYPIMRHMCNLGNGEDVRRDGPYSYAGDWRAGYRHCGVSVTGCC